MNIIMGSERTPKEGLNFELIFLMISSYTKGLNGKL